MEGDVVTLQDLFLFDYHMGMDEQGHTLGALKSTGLRPTFLEKLEAAGVRLEQGMFSFERFAR
jgi:pilus assembly protein CpaF